MSDSNHNKMILDPDFLILPLYNGFELDTTEVLLIFIVKQVESYDLKNKYIFVAFLRIASNLVQ